MKYFHLKGKGDCYSLGVTLYQMLFGTEHYEDYISNYLKEKI